MLKRVAKGLVCAGLLAVTAACSDPMVSPDVRGALENAEPAEIQDIIGEEAERLGITAMSVTILDGDSSPQSLYFGRAEEGGLFQAASLSKAAAAAVILTLADREGVALDDDIRGQITSLDIASLSGGDRTITLRQLLSHTTGASQSGYPGYPRDYDLPTAAEVISAPPRFFESALAFDGTPGEFLYSGGGYMIAQLWAEDVAGKPFETLADELLFGPLAMRQSTFAQPIDETEIAPLTLVGADASFDIFDGVFTSVEDSWHDYPEQAAAGLWTTSHDYARFAAALMDSADGAENAIPSAVAKEMIAPQVALEQGQHYGLGTQLVTKEDNSLRFVSHSGANTGYRALFSARPRSANEPRRVVVSFTNTTSGASLNEAVVFALTGK